MITKTDRDNAIDKVSYIFIDILQGWLLREKKNLEGYIANPKEHAEYNQYVEPNFDMLTQRATELGQLAERLQTISDYKKGSSTVTRSQHDIALENVPAEVFERLLSFMEERYANMSKIIDVKDVNAELSPVKGYDTMFSFNSTKFQADMSTYQDGIDGLKTVIAYKNQQASST